jgi:hypothetical protein
MNLIHRISTPIAAATAILVSTAGASFAMPPGYCSDYAGSAVREFYRAIDNPACSGVHGLRWHANYRMHFSWCLGASHDSTEVEWQARRDYLHQCGY